MANTKLSQIVDGGAVAGATDKSVVVRSGADDRLVTPVALDAAQTWTAAQTYTNSDIKLLGSSTGVTTFTSDNAGASNYTMHVPAANDTLAAIAAAQTLSNKTLTDPIETNTHRCTAQLDKTSSTALSNITGLVQTVVAGTYRYEINLDTTSTANGGVKVAFKFTTAVASTLNSIAKAFDAAAVAVARFTTATDQAPILNALVATVACEMTGTVIVTTGGTMQLQFAQNTSHSDTSSVLVGSSMKFTRLA